MPQNARTFYAKLVVGQGGSSNKRLLEAFSRIERERFLGKGPWHILAGDHFIETPSDDPRWLQQDVLVAIAPDRGINNGQPSLHARCLAACAPREAEVVLHIGVGTGYYTAILAEMVGPTGAVIAYEIDEELAARARESLAPWKNVTVIAANAMTGPLPTCDVIYVNAGATHPLPSWLDALAIGGRLVFPMTTDDGKGFMLLIGRWRANDYTAACLAWVRFFPCTGARDPRCARSLAEAMARSSPWLVRSLHRGDQRGAGVWCAGDGWWLSTEAPIV